MLKKLESSQKRSVDLYLNKPLTVSVYKGGQSMNSSYFKLPCAKQKKLINAGYKVFSSNPYKKGSMSFVAGEATISKSLLFYYFKNKKEYYLYLFDTAATALNDLKINSIEQKKYDLFELVHQEVERRLHIMQEYPYLLQFTATAYYETEEEVKQELAAKKNALTQIGKKDILALLDYDQFQNPADADTLIDLILFVAEGCMRGNEDLNEAKIRGILPQFQRMMTSLKCHYYKQGD